MRASLPCAVSLILSCATALPALATTIRDTPVPERMAQADAVVLGRVTRIERPGIARVQAEATGGRERLCLSNPHRLSSISRAFFAKRSGSRDRSGGMR